MKPALRDVRIALVDADLINKGSRHPNLALLKIAGLLHDNNIFFELVTDDNADISQYNHIYMSKVFTFSKDPSFYTNANCFDKKKFHVGGTGYYATETNLEEFRKKRQEDMEKLSKDPFLGRLHNRYGDTTRKFGIDMKRQMPYYDLYLPYINSILDKEPDEEKRLKLRKKYKDYLDYSIGFLTRGCTRHCPFCVNKLETRVVENSKLEWFYDPRKPYVYFWDDNFFAAPKEIWKPILQELIDKKIKFQFRQGLDERQFSESPDGEEMAEMLSKATYHGDYIFAFDNWRDREIIEKSLKVWLKYNPTRPTKFYLFCGFMQSKENISRFYKDIWELFQRIKILMQYGCIGYVMRHEDYHNAPIDNFYVQIARWCNQPAFYKKMSFWEYCYRNQSYWEQHVFPKEEIKEIVSFQEFEEQIRNGRYDDKIKMCLPLQTIIAILQLFPEHRAELIEMFNYKFAYLKNPKLWSL